MNAVDFAISGHLFMATGTQALYWPTRKLVAVSDLHLGKSERIARRSGQFFPPYETRDTLDRLEAIIAHFNPETVVCLGDSFDDIEAEQNLAPEAVDQVNLLMAGRDWVWIEGNHDPGPLEFGGRHLVQMTVDGITFRHIASDAPKGVEISGHYHPKARVALRGRSVTRPCFLFDQRRVIMPSFGTYTGGLFSTDPTLANLMDHDARAILTGVAAHIIPMPR